MPDSSHNDISTSGPVTSQSLHVSSSFTDFAELPSKGYCRLAKAQRYGVWNVLKGLKPQYADDEQYREMISKEFSLMVGLNHPNIVRAYATEQIPVWGSCIVMEFVDGRTLSDFLSENPSAELRRKVVDELLAAMAYFHKKQIVHQDLKPSNILVTHDGDHVKIIDFGLSDSREYAILKEPAYTKAYAAPEQLSGNEIDNRTDLYAFGLILRQLFPKRYNGIAKKCLQPQREKRYGSAEAVQNAIREADFQRKWLPAAICAVLVLFGLGFFFFYYFDNQNNETIVKKIEVPVSEQNLLSENDVSKGNNAASISIKHASKRTGEQDVTISENDAQEMLDQYIYNLKFEFDSIVGPFDKDMQEGKILYREIFHNNQVITLTKLHIHIQQRRQQLPLGKQVSFIQYAENLWARYAAKYPYTDENGHDLYPYYENLHKKGAISEEEYAQLSKEYEKGVAEIHRLAAQLKKETDKN